MSKSETRIYDIIAQGENMENVFHEETEISIGPQNIEEGNPELTSNGECAHVVPSLKEKDDNSMSTKKDCHPESKDGTFVKDYTVIANSVYVDKGDLEPGGIILEPISDDSLSLEDISEDEEGQIEIKDQPFAHSTLLLRNNEVESKRTELLPNRGTDINTPLPANVEKDLKMESIRNGDDDYAKFSAIPEDICIEENQGNVVEGESTVLEDDPGSFCNILDRRHGDFASEEVEETASPLSVRNPPHSENAEEDVSASQVLSEQDDKSLLEDPGEDNVIDRRTSPVNASSDIFSVDVQQMSPDGHSKTIEPCEKLPMEDVVSEEKSPGIIPMAQSQDSEDNKEVTSQGLVADHGNSILGTALESKNEVRVVCAEERRVNFVDKKGCASPLVLSDFDEEVTVIEEPLGIKQTLKEKESMELAQTQITVTDSHSEEIVVDEITVVNEVKSVLSIEDIGSDEEHKEEAVVEIFIKENGEAFSKCGGHIETLDPVHGEVPGSLLDETGIDTIIVEEKGEEHIDVLVSALETEKNECMTSASSLDPKPKDLCTSDSVMDVFHMDGTEDPGLDTTAGISDVLKDKSSLGKVEDSSTNGPTKFVRVVETDDVTLQEKNKEEDHGNEHQAEELQVEEVVIDSRSKNMEDEIVDVVNISPSDALKEESIADENWEEDEEDDDDDDDEEEEVTITGVCEPDSAKDGSGTEAKGTTAESSVGFLQHAIPPPPPKPEKPLTPYLRFKKKKLPAVRKEFPKLEDSYLTLLISNQWNMIKEEEKQEYTEEYAQEKAEYQKQMTRYYASPEYKAWVEAKSTLENAMSCRIKVSKLAEGGAQDLGKEDASKRTGQCNWCKNVGTLSNFSANLQGKEIYCTGLCSQKCFKEASMKICNLENGGSMFGKSGSNGSSHTDDSSSTGERSPVLLRSGTSSPTTNALGNFVWQPYLHECSAQAAPWQYFSQAQKPLQNDFARGMKLEAKDPRQDEAVCVATVVAILGPRLRLRFDGSDTTNDIWRLVDSEDIHPIGWAEKNGAMLHPPVGFRWDVGKFPEFLSKTLNEAMVASGDLFIPPPPTPTENLFQVGMKLEAVDRVNPALICVASVIDVKDSRIHVEFDGYKGSGYWCHYGDRDIFPAGWCFNNGYPLQPPGKKAYQNLSKEKAIPAAVSSRPVTRTNGDSSNKTAASVMYDMKETRSPVAVAQPPADLEIRQHLLNVIVYLNTDCHPGPYINKSKLIKLPKYYNGKGVVVMQTIIEDIISCAFNPKVVFGFLRPVARKTNCVITAHFDGVQYRCCLPNIEHMSTFWKTLEQFVDNLRCCENLLSATTVSAPCVKCSKGTPYSLLVASTKWSGAAPAVTTASSFQYIGPSVDTCHRVEGALATTAVAPSNINGDGPLTKRAKLDSGPIEINKPPRQWSIEEVARFIEQTDIREHANVFKMNEIDGKALLLLKREIVINYMGFKLGPAVKLLEIVDELREIQRNV